MKKNIKTLTALLSLLALITSITPVQPPFDSSNKPEISTCGDDDENDYDIIRAH